MVKTSEEEREGLLKEEQMTVIKSILFRYIKEAYQRFEWLMSGSTIQIPSLRIWLEVYQNQKTKKVEFNFIDENTRKNNNQFLIEIKTPITPKELGDIAKNAFRWFKQQMEKTQIVKEIVK